MHYYEDGNVQLNANKTFKSIVCLCLIQDYNGIDAILKFIMEKENEIHSAMGVFFLQDSVNLLKNLRRPLPITKSKVEWGSIVNCTRILM